MTERGEESQARGRGPRGAYSRRALTLIIVAGIAFAAGVAVGGSKDTSAFAQVPFVGDGLSATPDQSADLTDFWKAWNALDAQFVETHASSTIPTTKEKVWGAIQGLAASYGDPYTVYMPPEEAKLFADDISGNFGGVGMEIGIRDNVLTVVAPLKGTPAESAGIRAGDEILAIDGKSTEGMSTDAAVKAIRGPKGTVVDFSIVRAGKPLDIRVTRDTIQVPETDYGLDAKTGVFHIALYEFTQNSADLFDTAFAAFKKSGSRKLVIDLRGNPGGYLDAAVDIASHFLPKGAVIVTEDHEGKAPNEVHQSLGYDDVPQGTQVAVLMDQGSASASEILSGALHDHHVATLIGTRSFGKGSVQQLIAIDGGSLKVTIARWLTPDGKNISDGGLTPDIAVDRTAEDAAAGKDPQMDRAVEFLATGK
ncbi:MAG: PDZ domain-containing protein [Patescibacteria group bacterium]|nr:PDZ domain-containing protein [Patescibacteria group bacterium]MDE1966435.1 PDZ domain-containing protein [Patescibacteria group bacterium]